MDSVDNAGLTKEEDVTPTLRPISDVEIKPSTPNHIHEQCDALIRADTVDKNTSISILKLYGSMETIHAQLQHQRTCETETLRNEIRLLQLSQTHANGLEALTHRIAACEHQIKEMFASFTSLQTQQIQQNDKLEALAAQLQVVQSTRKR